MKKKARSQELAAALGRVASGLFVVTVRHGHHETGMLASWVQQCSFDPPQLTVAIQRGREIARWLHKGSTFVINILDESQTDMIIHFGRGFAPGEPAFKGLDVEHPDGAAAVLKESLAYLKCQVVGTFSAGDHDLYLGQVIDGKLLSEGHPMIHVRKSGFHY